MDEDVATLLTRTAVAAKLLFVLLVWPTPCQGQSNPDLVRDMQSQAVKSGQSAWGYWGTNSGGYYDWCNHSNRLVPVYTFGMDLSSVKEGKSSYRDKASLLKLYTTIPEGTFNPNADYFDQTDICALQLLAAQAGKKVIVLMVYDGLDWQTTRAAAIYRSGKVGYTVGRGTGLRFQDYRGAPTDFGFCVTSPHNETTEFDVNTQTLTQPQSESQGGYDFHMAGSTPWDLPKNAGYLFGWDQLRYHPVTDSANAATAMVTGRKTYNGSVNVDPAGNQLPTVAHLLQQQRGFSIGVVTNVPISHATPAAAYAHNVSRLDHQDLTRDLLGLPSIAHPQEPLPGVDVLLGAGWSDDAATDVDQGANHHSGNKYLTDVDRLRLDTTAGGKYIVAERSAGQSGALLLEVAARTALQQKKRLLGVFGVKSGHLPFQTANGDYQPTDGVTPTETYSAADLKENPTLAEMTRTALSVLSMNPNGFWMMVEAGDVDWASHDINIDNAIGAVLSGDEAFEAVVKWVEEKQAWHETAIIVTSDHGHGFFLTDPNAFAEAGRTDMTR